MMTHNTIRRRLTQLLIATCLVLFPGCGRVTPAESPPIEIVGSPAAVAQTASRIREFPVSSTGLSTPAGGLTALAVGPDGAVWFVDNLHVTPSDNGTPTPTAGNSQIGRLTSDGAITEYSVPTSNAFVFAITAGPDGNMWFTESELGPGQGRRAPNGKIGRITQAGKIEEFALPGPFTRLWGITTGPDGNVWFTAMSVDPQHNTPVGTIGRIGADGEIKEFALPTGVFASGPISCGPDNALWFATVPSDPQAGHQLRIGRISPDGNLTFLPVPATIVVVGNPMQGGLAFGSDGNLWFTEVSTRLGLAIGRMTPAGVVTEFPVPRTSQATQTEPDSPLGGLAAGANGNLWFADTANNAIGRITTDGTITEFPLPTPQSNPGTIVVAPDGKVWFTEVTYRRIGQFS